MNDKQTEQVKEMKGYIYAERFTAWADIQDDIDVNNINMTPEMYAEIKESIENLVFYPAQAAIKEIERTIEEEEDNAQSI